MNEHESEPDPERPQTGFLASITSSLRGFDWLQVPGVVRSVSRLVGSLGEGGSTLIGVGSAKASQWKQSIEADTAAKRVVSAAIAKQAAKTAAADPEIVQRHLEAWVGDRARKQSNKEAVATKTIELLSSDQPAADAPGPDDDWLNVFEQYAERCSSERLRATWAAVLAGEIRTKGSFSFQTMQFLSLLDQQTADALNSILPYVLRSGGIPQLERFNSSPGLDLVMSLDDLGLLRIGMFTKKFAPDERGNVILSFKRKAVAFLDVTDQPADVPTILTTRVASEILSVIDYDDNMDVIREVAEWHKQYFSSSKRRVIGDLSPSGQVTNLFDF